MNITYLNELLPYISLPLLIMARHLLVCRDYRSLAFINKKANKQAVAYQTEQLPLSVVISAHNQAYQLDKYLPQLLEQDYPDFEVIVVNDCSTDHTEEVLAALSLKYKNLYHTFTPPTARYVSHKKLSITLGVRAAKHDWIVLTEADAHPVSNQWLARMARNFTPSATIVLGYCNYQKENSLFNKYIVFDRLLSAMHFMGNVIYSDKAYRGDGCNMAFRKSMFLANKGFHRNLLLKRGEDALLVNEMALDGHTRVECSPESRTIQDMPFKHKTWRTDKVFYLETRLQFKASTHRRLAYLSLLNLLTYLCYTLLCFGIIWGIINRQYILVAESILLLLALYVGSSWAFNGSAKSIGEQTCRLLLPWFELIHPLVNIRFKLQHRFTRKSEFRRS